MRLRLGLEMMPQPARLELSLIGAVALTAEMSESSLPQP